MREPELSAALRYEALNGIKYVLDIAIVWKRRKGT